MNTIKAQVEFVQVENEIAPPSDAVVELDSLELAFVGGGTGDVCF